MKIMVSACLLGENCKYNGENNYNENVLAFVQGHDVIPVCPEVMGGLPTPRVPSEIRQGIVINQEGVSVDRQFRAGAKECLAIALKEQPELVIFKARSPSCGKKQHYDGTFTQTLTGGPGITAALLRENGFRIIEEDEIAADFEK